MSGAKPAVPPRVATWAGEEAVVHLAVVFLDAEPEQRDRKGTLKRAAIPYRVRVRTAPAGVPLETANRARLRAAAAELLLAANELERLNALPCPDELQPAQLELPAMRPAPYL